MNVNVQVDTSALAYTMLCYWHTSRMISDEQFLQMLTNLNSLLGKTDVPLPPLLSNTELSNTEQSPTVTRTKNNKTTLRSYI